MATNGQTANYTVTGFRVRPQTALNANGDPVTRIIVSYMIGPHGPFQDIYASGQYTAQAALDTVTKRVNEQRGLDQALTQLNQQSQTAY